MPATISNFSILRPDFELQQEEGLEWIAAAHARASNDLSIHPSLIRLLRKIGLGDQKIRKRGVSLADCFHQKWEEMEVYPNAGFGKRTAVFDRIASEMLTRFYPLGQKLPENMIHVTCTGYVAPSPIQKLIALRNAGVQTRAMHAYHMGCYASIPAIRIASGLAGSTEIVHTEICSLHMNPHFHNTEQLVVQTLFADGFIKYRVNSEGPGYEILTSQEEILADSTQAMGWVCDDWGLKMNLSKDVPLIIAKALPSFVEKLLHQAGVKGHSEIYYAIHPGGTKIISQVSEILNLEPHQYEHSLSIFQNFGNMSSATLPHIWEALSHDIKNGSTIVSLAFGPGLTLAGAVFRWVI